MITKRSTFRKSFDREVIKHTTDKSTTDKLHLKSFEKILSTDSVSIRSRGNSSLNYKNLHFFHL